jgi:hypothetical protein
MAYKDFSLGSSGGSSGGDNNAGHIVHPSSNATTLIINGPTVELPNAAYVHDAAITREGIDLVLEGPDGTVIIEGYFAAEPAPALVAPDGTMLTPKLVDSFVQATPEFASNPTANDASPVGVAQEVSGNATVTRADGTVETLTKGTPIFEGDIVQTDANGAVNIVFIDQTSFAVSEDAKLAIDKYVFDPATQSGTTDFSILKGMFVFTSGMIGREDPDDVKIETPAGSIGIRGTIIAGNVSTGEITVVEGAIVLRDFQGNEVTLANQYETARFDTAGGTIHSMGQISASDIGARFSSLSNVTPSFFTNVQQNAPAQNNSAADTAPGNDASGDTNNAPDAPAESAPVDAAPPPIAPLAPVNTGFGAPAGGFTSGAGNFGSAPGTLSGPMPPPPAPGGFMPPPVATAPPSPQQVQPIAPQQPINPNALPPSNNAPFFETQTVPEYFRATEGQTWQYNFDKEFRDADIRNGDSLTYELSAQTVANLNAWQTAGSGNFLSNWQFNTVTGQLNLNFSSGFGTPSAPGVISNIDLDVRAIDQSGATSGFQTYSFSAYDPDTYVTSGTQITAATQDGKIYYADNVNVTSAFIKTDNSSFFFNNGADSVTIINNGAPDTGSGNYLNLGNGINQVTVQSSAINNIIVGGNDADKFILQNVVGKFYGGDNDDEFVLDFSGGNIATELQTASSNTDIEGGHSNFRAGDILRSTFGLNTIGGTGAGRGDTLTLQGAGTLDFSTIHSNNNISGIERIDALGGTVQTITLRYQDVLDLNGRPGNAALIINLGTGDTLNLQGSGFNLSNMNKVADNFAIDDGIQGTPQNRDYDIYSDGNVTLLIHNQSGNAVVNFDGAPVTI